MAPGASATNDGFREFYAPLVTEPQISQQRPMPQVQHQISPASDNQKEAGCFGEIKNYHAGDEFLLLWKWVDDFMDKRRAKKKSSNSHIVNKQTQRQTKPGSQVVKRQATAREDLGEYEAHHHTPWGELLYRKWRAQQAEKKTDHTRQARGRSTNRSEPRRTTSTPPDQDQAANSQSGIGSKPIPVYNKKRGEVHKHAVKITQLPPIHNSVHLEHTLSNNYRAKPSPNRGQTIKSSRNTRFSDFLHQERSTPPSHGPTPSREMQLTYSASGQGNDPARNSRYSSILDPAKAIRKAKEAEKAKGPKCYICGSSSNDCPGGFRDRITNLWVCQACQKAENIGPVVCSLCGEPNSPGTGYASNGLWMCTACTNPTTPKELPPTAKLSCQDPSKKLQASRPPIPQGLDRANTESNEQCECDHPFYPIEGISNQRISICQHCHKTLTPFPVIRFNSASSLHQRDSHASLANQGVPIEEYNSDHLYSDDSYETRATTPPPQWPVGLGIKLQDSEEEEEEEDVECRPTPPLKDSKFYRESAAFPAMDYSQSYLRQPGMKHPYAPSPVPTTRKASASFAQDPPRAKHPSKQHHHQPQKQIFNPTTYPYPSPPRTPESLHQPRPASSVYPADESPSLNDFPFPPPPIPQAYANRPNQRSSSVSPRVVSKAALARSEMMSPRSYSSSLVSVSTEGGRKALNRRSSWYDFWKPVFEKPVREKSP